MSDGNDCRQALGARAGPARRRDAAGLSARAVAATESKV
jgi:hypothetical protein